MKGDEKVIEYFNKGLHHELTSVNQYCYRLLDNWGYRDLARKWRPRSIGMLPVDTAATRHKPKYKMCGTALLLLGA